MEKMNNPQRESISSSSSEDQQASSYELRAKPAEVLEVHFDKHCKYKRFEDFINGKTVIIHLRNCKCKSEYEDRSELANGKMDLSPLDGKEIHYDPECIWVSGECERNGHKVYVLKKYCNGCNTPRTNVSVTTVNMPQPSN